ncbi:MAG TPA: hypothetical protein VLH39_08290 [Magnetospirillaceae bacterium]|nr:hypothetical protein [Magnetospirillaceae bacterium]
MAKETKVYDYKPEAVRDRLAAEFRRHKGEATVADLVARTGFAKHQVETEVRAVSDEYGARLRVTESGEILYSFPRGLHSRYRGLGPSLKRTWKALRKGASAVAAFVFKIWIVVMLVGYFVLFIALALAAMAASIAAQTAGGRDSRDRGHGGGGGLLLTGRVLDIFLRIWLYGELFKGPEQRYHDRQRRATRSRERRPLHRAVFSFVFGDGDPNEPWDETEKKAVAAFIQSNRGVISLEEFMVLTGHRPLEAEDAINRYLYEFEGSPEVTDNGTIYYFFPALLRRKDERDRSLGSSAGSLAPMKRTVPFSANPKKANFWFAALNGVNLAFGSFFLANALTRGIPLLPPGAEAIPADFYIIVTVLVSQVTAYPLAAILWGLGFVPAAFAVLFYLVPFVRSLRLGRTNEEIKRQNLRRLVYARAWADPERVNPADAQTRDDSVRPKDGKTAEKTVEELAAWAGGNPGTGGTWTFPELARRKADIEAARRKVRTEDYALGGAVFDSEGPS